MPVGGIISLIDRVGLLTTDQLDEELKDFAGDYELEKYGLNLEKINQLPIGDITKIPGIKMVAVKEGAKPIDDSNHETALIPYTIIKFKDVVV